MKRCEVLIVDNCGQDQLCVSQHCNRICVKPRRWQNNNTRTNSYHKAYASYCAAAHVSLTWVLTVTAVSHPRVRTYCPTLHSRLLQNVCHPSCNTIDFGTTIFVQEVCPATQRLSLFVGCRPCHFVRLSALISPSRLYTKALRRELRFVIPWYLPLLWPSVISPVHMLRLLAIFWHLDSTRIVWLRWFPAAGTQTEKRLVELKSFPAVTSS